MNNLNSIILEGNLTKDPESTILPNGSQVCNMRLATNRYYKKGDEKCQDVMYIAMEAWNSTALVCEQYLSKGSWIRAVGRLKQERWKSEDGSSRERFVIVAEHIEFKDRKKDPDMQEHAAEKSPAFA